MALDRKFQTSKIVTALRSWVKSLWPFARTAALPVSTSTTDLTSGSLPKTPGDAGSDSDESQTGTVSPESPSESDRPSEDHGESGLLVDDSKPAETRPASGERATDQDTPEHEPPVPTPNIKNEHPPRPDQTELEKSPTAASAGNDDGEHTEQKTNGNREHGEPDSGDGSNSRLRNAPTKKREPRPISGKRGRQSGNSPPATPRPPSFRPELMCRKDSGTATWEVFLSADEQCPTAGVHVEGKALNVTGGQCHVPSLKGRLTASSQDGKDHDVPLFEGEPLIFKLRKNWSGEGRRISRITNGHFIVVAPNSWKRKGRAPVEPDRCADPGFSAHYFHRDASSSNGVVDGFREWGDSLGVTVIKLAGKQVFDNSNDGPLFVGDYPTLESSPEIEWARVGEETERGWGQNFRPRERSLQEVLAGREGRFFLRVYDSAITLRDSVAFRYVHDLTRIEIDGAEYAQGTLLLPIKSGYAHTEVRFIGGDGSTRCPVLPPQANQAMAPSGVIDVPPRPNADHISCTLGSGSGALNIVLNLPRVWWRLEVGHSGNGDWRDTPLVMTREEFRKHAYADAALSLLSTRHTAVRVGFDSEPTLPYNRKIEDECIVIPLAHFADHAQIDRRLTADAHFNVEWAEATVPLIVITADPLPEIVSFTAEPWKIVAGEEATLEWATRNADDGRVAIDPVPGVVESNGTCTVRPAERTHYTLTLSVPGMDDIAKIVTIPVDSAPLPGGQPVARVWSPAGGWRIGKGFSTGELRDAGLAAREATDRSISIDRRRRTSHRANVDAIRSMLDA